MLIDLSEEIIKKYMELPESVDLKKGGLIDQILLSYLNLLTKPGLADDLILNGTNEENPVKAESSEFSAFESEINLRSINEQLNRKLNEHKRTEVALRESEDRFRQLVQSVTDYIFTVTIENNQPVSTYHGPGCISVTGYSSEEYARDAYLWFRMIYEEDRDKVVVQASILLEKKSVPPLEHRIIHKDGTIRWVRSTLVAGYNENGVINKYDGLISDITERKKTEEALRDSERNLNFIFDQLSIGAVVVSLSFYFLRVNDMFIKMIGFSEEELKRMTFGDITHPDHKMDDVIQVKRLLKGEINCYITDKRYIRKDSEIIWGHVSVQVVKDSFGNSLHFSAMVEDITETKRALDLLKESEDRYRTLIEQTSDGVFVIDLNGNFTEVNSGGCRLLGYSKDKILSMNIKDVIAPEEYHLPSSLVDKLKMGESILIERNLVCSGRKSILTELNVKSLPDERFCAFVRDISERKKNEQEHLRLQNLESLGVLAGGIAHDFNNILSAILGRTSLAIEDLPDGYVKNNLLAVEKSTRKAAVLSNQLVTFAKGGSPMKKKIDIRKVIQDITRSALSESNVTAEYDFTDSLDTEADQSQIAQVIHNLILNAKESMPDGGVISISTRNHIDFNENLFLKIIIRDHGIGIRKDIINKIFDPYFTTKQSANGLGLSVVYSIIRRHGGLVSVDSEEGLGTTFDILLPAVQKVTEVKRNLKDDGKKALNILIMDDEEEVRELLSAIIEKFGYKVEQSANGEEAIYKYELAKESGNRFDLVILDMIIKDGLSGKETIKKLREYDPDIKAIVSSGFSDNSLSGYKEIGFDGLLKKPYTKNELENLINRILF